MKKIFSFVGILILALTLAACGGEGRVESVDITLQSDVVEAELTQDPVEVTEGMDVTVTASEVSGYYFVHWVDTESDDEVSTDRRYTFQVEGPITLKAVYEASEVDTGNGNGDEPYTVNLSSDHPDAALTVSAEGPYEDGDEITIDANDIDTYSFVHWLDTNTDTILSANKSHTFTVDGDMSIKAVYEDVLNAEERTAQMVVDEANSDMANLDTLMSTFDPVDGMTMTMTMAVDQENPMDSTETITSSMMIELATQMDGEDRLTKLSLTMDMPDMTDESIALTMIMEETPEATTFIMDVGMLLDRMQEDEGLDFRTLMDLNSDYVHLTIPHDLEGTGQEVLYDQIMETFYVVMFGEDYDDSELPDIDQATMDAVMANIEGMMDFMTFAHLSTYDYIDFEMNREGTLASGTLSMGGLALRAFAEDLFEEIYTTIELLDDTGELAPYEDVITMANYSNIMGGIGMLPNMNINMEYDASTETMHIDLGIMAMFNFLTQTDESLDHIQDITMEMMMEKTADIDVDISNSKNLESIAEEVVKGFTVVDTVEYLGAIANDQSISAGTYSMSDLELMGHYYHVPFIDKDLSNVIIDDSNDTLTFHIELYYAHNQDPVFTDTRLSMSNLTAVLSEEPTTRADVEAILALVDSTHFELYGVLSEMVSQTLEEPEEIVPTNPIPEEDQTTVSDPVFFSRYPGSVMIDYETLDSISDSYVYAVDAQTVDVYTHFAAEFDTWNEEYINETYGEYMMMYYSDTEGYFIGINISKNSEYDSAIQYSLYVEEIPTS